MSLNEKAGEVAKNLSARIGDDENDDFDKSKRTEKSGHSEIELMVLGDAEPKDRNGKTM